MPPGEPYNKAYELAANLAEELNLLLQPLKQENLTGYTIQWRVKSEASIARKLATFNNHRTSTGALAINDFIGLRVVVLHLGLLQNGVQIVSEWAKFRDLRLLEASNAFVKPTLGNYRSIHLDFELKDPLEWGLTPAHGIEIQLTTYLQHFHAMISREWLYEPRNESDEIGVVPGIASNLANLSDQLNALDEVVALIAKKASRK